MKSPKILNGRELAGFIKERQATTVQQMAKMPTLLIIRDSDNPVITKYVQLKINYGKDIGANVIDYLAKDSADLTQKIQSANADPLIHGIIVQLPLLEKAQTDEITNLITPTKDVDGLGQNAKYDSATATAILWLLAGYDIDLKNQKIALVGRGKLVGAPLLKMFQNSSYSVEMFHRGSDLTKLRDFNVIITATGHPDLILDEYVSPGTILVDAGTASEGGVLKGDLSASLYARTDLTAITPLKGGVGPLTITCLFEHLLQAAQS